MVLTLNKCLLLLVLLFSWLAAYTLFYFPPPPQLYEEDIFFYSPIKNESQTKQVGQLAWAMPEPGPTSPTQGWSNWKAIVLPSDVHNTSNKMEAIENLLQM